MRSGRLSLSALCILLAVGGSAAAVFAEEGWGESPFLIERNAPQSPDLPGQPREQEVRLQGILWDPEAPTAILNNRVVSRGDSVGRWEVQEIQKDRVVLSNGSETRVLQSE